jgi:endoglucanase
MRRIGYRLIAALIAIGLLAAADEPPPTLRRGIDITHWFRYPPDGNPAALRNYVDDAALEQLRRLGFTFIRLPVQPSMLSSRDAIVSAIARVERHGLAAVVALFPTDWKLEGYTHARSKVISAWRFLAPGLRHLGRADKTAPLRHCPEV